MRTASLSPQQRYERELAHGAQADLAQATAVTALNNVHQQLLVQAKKTPKKRFLIKPKPQQWPQGLYMWGGVGRGKTWLMDLFYESIESEHKVRIHFHRFMQQVHAELHKVGQIADPLETVADTIVGNARIICFDEFFVSDITDAMLLGGLFQALFKRGITLITTSNIPPDKLYYNGLQRARFLPAIEMLKQHCQVMNVDGGNDYRLRALKQANTWHANTEDLHAIFQKLANQTAKPQFTLNINRRPMLAEYATPDLVWFSFTELCDGPRSQNDYIELARQFHTVFLSQLPMLDGDMENQARRFINLVDEFYDRNVKLIVSAAALPEQIYHGQKLAFEFQRTLSRLQEMQSTEYLARPHLP